MTSAAWAKSLGDQYTQVAKDASDRGETLKASMNAGEASKYYAMADRFEAVESQTVSA